MKKLFVLCVTVAALLLTGCAIKTASTVDPTKQVTTSQLKQEEVNVNATFAARQAEIEAEATATTATLNKKVAVLNSDKAASKEKFGIANADLVEQYEMRNYLFTTSAEIVKGAVPAPWGTLAGIGLTLGGIAFGLAKRGQTITANAQTTAVVMGVANAPIPDEQKALVAESTKSYAAAGGVKAELKATVTALDANVAAPLPSPPA